MKIKRKKLLFIIGGIITLIVVLYTLYICGSSGVINLSQKRPEIDFLDIGQGDSSLIKLPGGRVILIDGGPDNLVLHRLGENLPFYHRKIDLIILSHFHDDHIIGLLETIRRYKVGTIIYMDGSPDSALLKLLILTAEKKNIKVIAIKNQASLSFPPGCTLKIINPLTLGVKVKADDNNSLVAKLDCKNKAALFSGDNSTVIENALLKTGINLAAEVFKASHHGSKTANSPAFLKAVNPLMGVISVGAENRFGHPNPEILETFNELGIKIKRTDKNGTVKISF